jgi:hypothetical protein
VGPVKLYWRYLEVYFGVNDIHRVILWPLLLCFCEAPSFALLVAASQQRNNLVDQALYDSIRTLTLARSLSLSLSLLHTHTAEPSLELDQGLAGKYQQWYSISLKGGRTSTSHGRESIKHSSLNDQTTRQTNYWDAPQTVNQLATHIGFDI